MYISYTPYFPNPKAVNLLSSKIKSVDPGSPGQLAGILPGDTLVSINGKDVVDVLDYKFYSYDPRLKVELADAAGNRRTLRVRKGEGEDLGLEFETYLMDRARSVRQQLRLLLCGPDAAGDAGEPLFQG